LQNISILFDDGAAGEGVELSGHDGLHEFENEGQDKRVESVWFPCADEGFLFARCM